MTKKVSIKIEGLQLGSEEEPVVTQVMGTYHLHNDRHYIQYEETTDSEEMMKNTIKIGLTKVELTKKGKDFSQMIFDLKEMTEAVYHTIYGNLCFEVETTEISVEETQDSIEAELRYSLFTNGAPMSENIIKITISAMK